MHKKLSLVFYFAGIVFIVIACNNHPLPQQNAAGPEQKSQQVQLDDKTEREDAFKLLLHLNNQNPPDDHNRFHAIDRLGILGVKEAIPEIRKFLHYKEESLRRVACLALGELDDKESIPELINLLTDKDVRGSAVEALGKLQAREAIQPLIKLLKEEEAWLVVRVAKILVKMEARESIPELIGLLNGSDINIQYSAIEALVEFNAKEAIPHLMKLLSDVYGRMYEPAADALAKLGAKEVIPEMMRIINNKDESSRWLWAAEILAGFHYKEAVPRLLELVNLNLDIVLTFGELGDREAVPKLLEILKTQLQWGDYSIHVRGFTAIALVELGAGEKLTHQSIMDIREVLRIGTNEQKTHARKALKSLGEKE